MINILGFYNLPLSNEEREELLDITRDDLLQLMQKKVYQNLSKEIKLTDIEKLDFITILQSKGSDYFKREVIEQKLNKRIDLAINDLNKRFTNEKDKELLSKIKTSVTYSDSDFELVKNKTFISLELGLLYNSEQTLGLFDFNDFFESQEIDEMLIEIINKMVFNNIEEGHNNIYYDKVKNVLKLMNAEKTLENIINVSNKMKSF